MHGLTRMLTRMPRGLLYEIGQKNESSGGWRVVDRILPHQTQWALPDDINPARIAVRSGNANRSDWVTLAD